MIRSTEWGMGWVPCRVVVRSGGEARENSAGAVFRCTVHPNSAADDPTHF